MSAGPAVCLLAALLPLSAASLVERAPISWRELRPAGWHGHAPAGKGGTVAEPGELPFAVAVLSRFPGAPPGYHTGAIISRDWVLTAACSVLFRESPSLPYEELDSSIVTISACWKTNLTMQGLKITTYHYMKEFIDDNKRDRDIAVLKMEKPWEWSWCIQPILLSDKESFDDSRPCLAVGFGVTRPKGKDHGVLRQMRVLISECWNLDPREPGGRYFVCLQSLDKTPGVCSGDEGGPLLCPTAHGPLQVGLVYRSRGDCNAQGRAALFIPVQSCKEWLTRVVGAEVYAPYGSRAPAPRPEYALAVSGALLSACGTAARPARWAQ